jgi:predicted nucleic acid-binding Zn finger protein
LVINTCVIDLSGHSFKKMRLSMKKIKVSLLVGLGKSYDYILALENLE